MPLSRFFGASRRAATLGILLTLAACQGDERKQDQPKKQAAPVTKTTLAPNGSLTPPKGAGTIAGVEAILAATITNEAVRAAGPGGNVVLSPASILQGLGLVAAGAAGDTHDEMEITLGWSGDNLAPKIANHGKGFKGDGLQIANALWLDDQLTVKDSYRQSVARDFGASVDTVDFQSDASGSAERINKWVSDTTKGRIANLISPESINRDTRGILVNALWFRGEWSNSFYDTKKGNFTSDNGKKQPADLMRSSTERAYAEDAGWQMVRLSYSDGRHYMDIYLPPADTPDAAIEATQLANWNTALGRDYPKSRFFESEIVLTLPRFEVRETYNLSDMLIAMGMPRAFSDAADFSKMVDVSQPKEKGVKINGVVHATFLRVDEYGTEAAAATATEAAAAAAEMRVPPKVTMTVDRPFYFAIRNRQNDGTLFFGRIANPIRTTPGVDPYANLEG